MFPVLGINASSQMLSSSAGLNWFKSVAFWQKSGCIKGINKKMQTIS